MPVGILDRFRAEMTFNLAATHSVNDSDSAVKSFYQSVFLFDDAWYKSVDGVSINASNTTEDYVTVTRKPINSSLDITEVHGYITSSSTTLNIGTGEGASFNSVYTSSYTALRAATGGAFDVSFYKSDVDPRSWFMLAGNQMMGLELGDNFYKYSPLSGGSKPFYFPVLQPFNQTYFLWLGSNITTADNDAGNDYPLFPFHMYGMGDREDVEGTFTTDVVTLATVTSGAFNLVGLGARSDIRQIRTPNTTSSNEAWSTPVTSYFDGTDYWIRTNSANENALMFNVGPTDPGF